MASQRPLTITARNDISLTVLPPTSDLHDMPSIRVTVKPGEGTGRSDDGRQQTIRTPRFSPCGELDTEKQRPRQIIGH